ncbi:MAG: Unknown protein [uncultured Thiotrichaceae bacterium]|uniref:DUF3465 domain-containing protein n=1 Tax=uncultured Thiotrichaceae bacterium TaxID=298394 RepID=A0A6S6UG42_9GAMM|nr:MAG: Unknown protein [uncultured Thiotrichaceae bacterium]
MKAPVKKLLLALVILIGAGIYDFVNKQLSGGNTSNQTSTTTEAPKNTSQNQNNALLEKIRDAAVHQKSGWWLETEGVVIKNLKDDTKGHQHQKFLLKLAPDITLLVAHNIDLAPRANVQKGDKIKIRGRYEWNNRGGVLHWTHHDPKGRKEGGWIFANGKYFK